MYFATIGEMLYQLALKIHNCFTLDWIVVTTLKQVPLTV